MFIYLDTETTGVEDHDRLCQIAYKMDTGDLVNELFRPPVPISIGAMKTHHITEKMVADKPAFNGSQTQADLVTLLQNSDNVLIAHNAQFDTSMLNKEGVATPRVICTLKLIRFLDTEGEIPEHNLQYLRYYYGMEINAKAHDALGDILVMEQLFLLIWGKFIEAYPQETIVQEMIRITNSPVLLPIMPIGKHKGLNFRDVPKDYLQWMVGRDFDGDLLYTAEYYMNN